MATRRVVLKFPQGLVEKPIVYQLVTDHNLMFNILRADVREHEGLVVLGLEGEDSSLDAALTWASDQGVVVQPLSKDVVRDEELCTHCGACTAVCPTGALAVEIESRNVIFDSDECVACELCVPACPYHAMQVAF